MGYESLFNTIRKKFEDEVKDVQGYHVQYDDQEGFNKPDFAKWMRVSIRPSETNQATLGEQKKFRRRGVMIIQIFTPSGEGDESALEVADVIDTAFKSVTADGVTYQTPYIEVVGRNDNYWQINVTCPFYSDDTQS